MQNSIEMKMHILVEYVVQLEYIFLFMNKIMITRSDKV